MTRIGRATLLGSPRLSGAGTTGLSFLSSSPSG